MKKLMLSALIALCLVSVYVPAHAEYAIFQQRKIEIESGALSGDHTEELEQLNKILSGDWPSGDIKFNGLG